MKLTLILPLFALSFLPLAEAKKKPNREIYLDFSCFETGPLDGRLNAHFLATGSEIKVTLNIPTSETSTEEAVGSCVSEEDSRQIALRCDSVKTKNGTEYFARMDGSRASIARGGKTIAGLICYENSEE